MNLKKFNKIAANKYFFPPSSFLKRFREKTHFLVFYRKKRFFRIATIFFHFELFYERVFKVFSFFKFSYAEKLSTSE